ncbi:MAG TPA: glycosyltransferase family 4 protein, partial [Blastocatellia bacterium]|nr:glycosyltransferase family 4 protein [Blastocatellia bacterium]
MVTSTAERLGGHAVQAGRMLEGLSRERGVRAELLPINPRLPGPLRLLQRVKYVRTLVTWPVYVLSLLVKLPRYDVVHVFAASYLSFLLTPTPAILIAKLYGKPVLLNYRSGEAEDHLARWRRTTIPTLRLADRVIAPSGYLVDVFARFNIEASAIFNIVEADRFRFRERRRLRPIFFSNRNLESLYNVECTLRAFAIIQQRFPEASLIVAGDGGERERLEELARELALRNVEFKGRVSPEKMHELYAAADIYLNTPDIDNMPASILEAFASGLAVVTTDAG